MSMTRASDGANLHWRSEGPRSAPALVLLNSIGTDLSLYDAVIPHLAGTFRLLRLDTRGHGLSDAPEGDYDLERLALDVLEVMDAAEIQTAVLCGVSLGGMMAMRAALMSPARIEGLVLVCTSAAMDRAAWQARVQTVRAEGMSAIVDLAISRFVSDAFVVSSPAAVRRLRDGVLATPAAGYAGCAAAIRDMDLLSAISSITVPVLMICGAKDVSTPFADHGDKVASAIPKTVVAELDTAHLPPIEDPVGFSELIARFLGHGPV
jgi:3-oxoadipate enol-lactonase/4-carboxymuconolactone decarboxylase